MKITLFSMVDFFPIIEIIAKTTPISFAATYPFFIKTNIKDELVFLSNADIVKLIFFEKFISFSF